MSRKIRAAPSQKLPTTRRSSARRATQRLHPGAGVPGARARLAEADPVSIGLASFPRDGTDAHALLDRARALMEQARHGGGNRVRDADHAE